MAAKESIKQEIFQEIARDLPLEVLLNTVATTSPFGARFTLWRSATGHVLLKIKCPIPEREQWLFSNTRALEAVHQGLKESAAGAVKPLRYSSDKSMAEMTLEEMAAFESAHPPCLGRATHKTKHGRRATAKSKPKSSARMFDCLDSELMIGRPFKAAKRAKTHVSTASLIDFPKLKRKRTRANRR